MRDLSDLTQHCIYVMLAWVRIVYSPINYTQDLHKLAIALKRNTQQLQIRESDYK